MLDTLVAKRVVERLGGDGPAVWATPGREEVFERLRAALETDLDERLRQHQQRAEEVQELLATELPTTPQADLPYVHLLRGANHVKATYDRLLAEAHTEMSSSWARPTPPSWPVSRPCPAPPST